MTNEVTRIDGVNAAQDATIAQNNADSIARDADLQGQITTNQATSAAQNTAINDRVTNEK